ncbi:GNAT family N-acetyltransferase [Streptomyces sp. CMB-StM0423]|uniref:GNAT family N-acetyltransferase n=1 Tax=Streptomyces sp. CMB-StM0423 TaxID=2059884 RepID=UPI000C714B25|nr:GNAT family N-acetyltransferase [Streptomyces sp. CMB-StM0423]AUH44424.1 GNAT family N-acetyltransferase [Streptomyces sp. CMB-StM0423]
MTPDPGIPAAVAELDAYLDAAPRPDCDAVEVGPFTLFVSRSPWPYYARPTVGRGAPVTGGDLDALAAACAEHGVATEIEWVHEVRPELAGLVGRHGLALSSHALMRAQTGDVTASAVDGVTLRVVEAGDPALLAGRATADVAFTAGGTGTGPEGAAERDAFLSKLDPEMAAHLNDRARRGLTVTAVAEDPMGGVVAAGSYQPVGEFAEIMAVATLPSARRRGLAGALTALLARHAHDAAGVRTVLLSAQDDAVARVYARVGFRQVGTAHAAEAAG